MFGNSDWDEPDIDGKNANGEYVAGFWKADSSDEYHYVAPYCNCEEYKYQFKDLESLVSSKIFQDYLTKALAFKDKEIDALRNELIKNVYNRR